MKGPNLEQEERLLRNDLVCGIGRTSVSNVGLLFVVKDARDWPRDKPSGKKGGPLGEVRIKLLCMPDRLASLTGAEDSAVLLLSKILAIPGCEDARWFFNGNRLRKVGNWNDE